MKWEGIAILQKPIDKRVEVLGVPFSNVTMQEMNQIVHDFSQSETKDNLFVVTANPEIVYYAKTNDNYMTRIKAADYIIADGIGVVKAAKTLGRPLKERVPGIELMETMLEIANQQHQRVFLLGASKETVKKCKKKLKEQYPNIKFKAKHGYKDLHDYKRLQQVKKFEPDYIFVAMGYPKQESWIYYNKHHFNHTVMMGVGGSFDVFSGNVKRAPQFFIKLNLEWLYRILTDYKRLKRAVVIPLFLWEVRKQRFNERMDPHAHLADKD